MTFYFKFFPKELPAKEAKLIPRGPVIAAKACRYVAFFRHVPRLCLVWLICTAIVGTKVVNSKLAILTPGKKFLDLEVVGGISPLGQMVGKHTFSPQPSLGIKHRWPPLEGLAHN